jgi:excisionase family DNA binding protein
VILTGEAARLLGVSSEMVRVWERRGRLSAVKTAGGVRLFNRLDVENLAKERCAAIGRQTVNGTVAE